MQNVCTVSYNASSNINLGEIFIAINSWNNSFAAYGICIVRMYLLLLQN